MIEVLLIDDDVLLIDPYTINYEEQKMKEGYANNKIHVEVLKLPLVLVTAVATVVMIVAIE